VLAQVDRFSMAGQVHVRLSRPFVMAVRGGLIYELGHGLSPSVRSQNSILPFWQEQEENAATPQNRRFPQIFQAFISMVPHGLEP
jgi:hypothetical protein